MAMFKHVAGIGNVEMSPEEEAEILAEWEANDPAKRPQPDPLGQGNGAALDERRRESKKDEIDDRIAKNDLLGAVKLMRELIP